MDVLVPEPAPTSLVTPTRTLGIIEAEPGTSGINEAAQLASSKIRDANAA